MKLKRKIPKTLTDSEMAALSFAIKNTRDKAAFALMKDGGLRVSEAANLKLEELHWDTKEIQFIGKGSKEGKVLITSRLRDVLELAIKHRPPQAEHTYVLWDLKNPAKKTTRHALLKMIERAGRKAGLSKKVYCHMLRHSGASELYKETKDIHKVQRFLRHDSARTTEIYIHLMLEDLRDDLEHLDKRPSIIKLWSRFKPNVIPDFLKPKPKPFFIGELVGREKEISILRTAFKDKRNTVLIGNEGVGKKHLLNELYKEMQNKKEPVVQIEEFRPTKAAAVMICELLKEQAIINEVPTGNTNKIIQIIKDVSKEHPFTLIIQCLDGIEPKEIRILKNLVNTEHITLFSSITVQYRAKLKEIFFGNYQEVELFNLDKQQTITLAAKLISDMNVPDRTGYMNHLYSESEGNPKALIELVQETRYTGQLYPKHLAVQKVLSATPILSLCMMGAVASRYSASALSSPDWKIFATLVILGIAPLVVLDMVLKRRRK